MLSCVEHVKKFYTLKARSDYTLHTQGEAKDSKVSDQIGNMPKQI